MCYKEHGVNNMCLRDTSPVMILEWIYLSSDSVWFATEWVHVNESQYQHYVTVKVSQRNRFNIELKDVSERSLNFKVSSVEKFSTLCSPCPKTFYTPTRKTKCRQRLPGKECFNNSSSTSRIDLRETMTGLFTGRPVTFLTHLSLFWLSLIWVMRSRPTFLLL